MLWGFVKFVDFGPDSLLIYKFISLFDYNMNLALHKQQEHRFFAHKIQQQPPHSLFKIQEQENSHMLEAKDGQEKKINIKKLCNRCKTKQDKVECEICGVMLCRECDQLLHNIGKFSTHQRRQIFLLQSDQNENKMNIRINEVKQEGNLKNLQSMLTTLNITQKWNKIIKEIEIKFSQLASKLKDKEEDILSKLQKRREQELKSYMESFNEQHSLRKSSISDESMKRSQASDKNEAYQTKIRLFQCQHQDEMGKCLGKVEINYQLFEQMKNLLQKFEVKTLAAKTLCQQPQLKKKMRSSLLSINSIIGSSLLNLGLKSPKSGKQKFSNSIMIQQMKNIQERLNEQELEDSLGGTKLQKVKSEKLLVGKAKNMSFNIKQRDRKIKKLGIMI